MIETNSELYDENAPLACYNKFRAELAKLDKHNSSLVFDYDDDKGQKDARSHIYKLRRTKTAVDKARKEAKQDALDYGRRVDGEAAGIVEQIQTMIQVHQKPLDEIEEREAARVLNIKDRIDNIRQTGAAILVGTEALRNHLSTAKLIEIDASFGEYMAVATVAKDEAVAAIQAGLTRSIEQDELINLRAADEAAEREKREAMIAEQAKAAAIQDAEERARQEAEKADAQIREAKEAASLAESRLEQEKADSIKRELAAKEAARLASAKAVEDANNARLAQELADKKSEDARQKNKEHRKKINNQALEDLMSAVAMEEDDAKNLIEAIAKGHISNIRIEY
jgi:colicin import membrane protein